MKIFVDELPKNCKGCNFYEIQRYRTYPWEIYQRNCLACNRRELKGHRVTKGRAKFCPLRELKIDGEKR